MSFYLTYDATTATASGRWSRRKKHSDFLIFAPDLTVFTTLPRPVVFLKHGGARMNPGDIGIASTSTTDLITDTMGAYLVIYDCPPGGFYNAGAQDPDCEFWPESVESDIEALAWFISRHDDSALWGAGSISQNPDLRMHWGSSSGGWDVLHCQLSQDGAVPYGSGPLQRGEDRFAINASHLCNVVFVNQPQVMLSTFTAVRAATATYPTPHTFTYTVNGAHAIGSGTLAVTGDTEPIYTGSRLIIGSSKYVATADYAGGPGSISVYPLIDATLSGGEAISVDFSTSGTDVSKYHPYAWCGSYLFRNGIGWTWDTFPSAIKEQSDVTSQVTSSNPRVTDVAWVIIGATANEIITSALTGERSFLNHVTPGTQEPAFNELHSEHQGFWLAYCLDLAGNTTDVHLYQGNTVSNPTLHNAAWNKGRNAGFSPSVLQAVLESKGWLLTP